MGSLDAVEIAADLERWLGAAIVAYGHLQLPQHRRVGAVAGQSAARMRKRLPHRSRWSWRRWKLDRSGCLQDVRRMTEQELKAFIAEEMAKQEGK